MPWLYELQQRLSITRRESLAVLTIAFLFLLGLTVRHLQQQRVPPLAVDSLSAPSGAASPPIRDSASSSPPSSPTAASPLNVNSASQTALQALPGIGPALSDRILAYRTRQHAFQSLDELTRVRGIGPKTLEDLRPLVRVAPPDTSAAD
jgi:competence protein ComEA